MGRLYDPRPPVEVASSEGDEQSRAVLFRRLLIHLDRGGFVVVALDIAPGASVSVSCLGRPLSFARGPFALARLTGAPLLPLVAGWKGGGIEILLGEGLAAEPEESALAASAARWLESYLLASPAQLGLGLLRALLGLTGGS
jgi:lauroyl/myristoyl acyltransferase